MPRSPSRDLADRYDGNRGYFRRPDGPRRWRYGLAGVALLAPVGWAAFDLAGPPAAADSAHTHGPLASVHAAWGADCAACHTPHAAAEFLRDPASALKARDRWLDLTCEKCHAGPAHHAAVADGGAFHAACANCHHDHGGRANSLVRIADAHCTGCHADLPAHTDPAAPPGGGRPYAPTITAFASDHPEFRPLTTPPDRTLAFSHAVHMTPGLPHTPGGREALTGTVLRKLFSEDAAKRYEVPGKPDDLIRLTCADCHRLDAGDTDPKTGPFLRDAPRRSVLPDRAEGAYYLPVNFDAHCKACHPLRVPEFSGGLAGFEAPHRRQPAELTGVLLGEFARRLATDQVKPAAAPAGPTVTFTAPRDDPAAVAFRARADQEARDALGLLVKGSPAAAGGGNACGKCHAVGPAADSAKVVVPAVPDRTVWFRHAKFSHVAHRGQACTDCHPRTADPLKPGDTIVPFEPVQIAGAASCRGCHAPAGREVDTGDGRRRPALGVRHGCVDCHRYHNGDHPLQGRGAAARNPLAPLTADEFRRGGR